MEAFGFYIGVTVLIVMFYGEPDLHDKLMDYLSDKCAPAQVTKGE